MKVTETFVSLQGEGIRQGKVCFFLRLSGCNLRCRWCDTKYSFADGAERSADEIADEILKSDVSYVCVTGGEPLLQKDELITLLKILGEKWIQVDIETNGTVPFEEVKPYASICMDVKCPSSGEESDLSLLKKLSKSDTVKFVIGDDADYKYMTDVLASNSSLAANICVTPVFGCDVNHLAEKIVKDRLAVRFQLQLHKYVGVK
ncbi:MAG TPA: radical SAM protein [Methanocorpusculum sp.]|nr:radical SAM protein [Methanocorpusculum sp.]